MVYADNVWLGGGVWGGVLNCAVDHILQKFYTLFLTRFRTYKITSPPQTKMTRKDEIKELVSLKVHKHEILFLTFFAETETLWSQGPVTRDF